LKTGNYSLSAKANGTTKTISFSIVSGSGGGGTSSGGSGDISLVLVNTSNQSDITTINSGYVIDLSKVGTNIGIRAEIPGGASGVNFNLSGPYSTSRSEGSSPPWSLFGDIGIKINPWPGANLKEGNYTLSARANGKTVSVSFQVVSGQTANARDIPYDFLEPSLDLPQVTSIYPNPVTDNRLNVAFNEPISGPVSYTIFDTTGKSIQLEEIDTNNTVLLRLPLSDAVSPGIYYLKLRSREHGVVWNYRFIKTH
jgi:hypothetical protein